VLDLNDLLQFTVEHRGSDLHLKVGSPPHVRVDGHLMVTSFDSVTPADTERIAFSILPPERAEEFLTTADADFALSVSGLGRFRVNVFRQRGSVGMVLRRVLPGTPSFELLGLPGSVARLADEQKGFVLVTGPAGSGRTTTMASMVDHINASRAVNIVTIEDPIEVLHPDKVAIVNQRELGTDTRDYASALRRVLRQDPDVIVVGEITDSETAWAAMSAAATGHLVISIMDTHRVAETVKRFADFFPPHQRRQVCHTLASCLRGIISQQLLERADGRGRVPAVELLVATSRVCEVVEDPDAVPEHFEELMCDGEYHGMQTFDQSLFGLYKNGLVSLRDVLSSATHPHEFRIALQTAGLLNP